jgi:hypothetical protein
MIPRTRFSSNVMRLVDAKSPMDSSKVDQYRYVGLREVIDYAVQHGTSANCLKSRLSMSTQQVVRPARRPSLRNASPRADTAPQAILSERMSPREG